MKPLLFLFCLFSVLGTPCFGQEEASSIDAAKEHHLLFPSPPLGFQLTREAVLVDKTFIGFKTVLEGGSTLQKVVVRVDLRKDADFSIRGWRSGAVKGYLDGFLGNVRGAGFTKLVDKKIPDIDGSDLREPLLFEFEFENENGGKLFAVKRVFFDSRGFDIYVFSDSKDMFDELKAWASDIQTIDRK